MLAATGDFFKFCNHPIYIYGQDYQKSSSLVSLLLSHTHIYIYRARSCGFNPGHILIVVKCKNGHVLIGQN